MGKVAYDFVEFSFYDSIVNGGRRPFLDEYSSDENAKKLFNKLRGEKEIQFESGDKLIDEISAFVDEHCDAKEGDRFEVTISEGEGVGTIIVTPVEPEGLNDLFDIDIPPPPDKKSEIFLNIITNEYDRIKQRAQKALETFDNEEPIVFFANRNLQNAKRIAVDAHHVSKQLKSPDRDIFDDPNSYIFYILKHFLLRSIMFYQGLFEPYIKSKIYNYDELRVFLFHEKPAHILSKEFDERVAQIRLQKRLPPLPQKIVDKQKIHNCFSLEGDYWKIRFNGEETILKNLKRVRYIVRLLENPGKEFCCHELESIVSGKDVGIVPLDIRSIDPNETDFFENSEDQKIHAIDPAENDIYENDLKQYEEMANDLWEKKNEAFLSESERTKAERDWEKLVLYFSQIGLGWHKSKNGGLKVKLRKRLKKEFDRFRINVQKQITKTRVDIEKIMPSLSKYLKRHIKTGMKCEFRPDPDDAGWEIRWKH
jgi:hypothetical protein